MKGGTTWLESHFVNREFIHPPVDGWLLKLLCATAAGPATCCFLLLTLFIPPELVSKGPFTFVAHFDSTSFGGAVAEDVFIGLEGVANGFSGDICARANSNFAYWIWYTKSRLGCASKRSMAGRWMGDEWLNLPE